MSNYLGNQNLGTQYDYLSSVWVYYVALLSLGKWVSSLAYPQMGLHGRWGSIVNKTQNIFLWLLKKKKKEKRPHYELNLDHQEYIQNLLY